MTQKKQSKRDTGDSGGDSAVDGEDAAGPTLARPTTVPLDPIVLAFGAPRGTAVVNRTGEPVGTVENPASTAGGERMPYALVAFDGRLGLDDKLFIVPWQVLQLDPANRRFVLTISQERLAGAPGFDRERWPNLADPLLRHAVRAHYGYGPATAKPAARPRPWLQASRPADVQEDT